MTGSAFSCTRVFWHTNKKAKVVGRTMDLFVDDQPRMVIYPRSVERDGGAGDNSLKWKAKYDSLVMTAFEAVVADGMNEHGLAAHLTTIFPTSYMNSGTIALV